MYYFCKYIIALALIDFAFVQGGILGRGETCEKVIYEVLEETNKTKVNSESMRFALLSENPTLIPILAQWQYNDWHTYDISLTQEQLIHAFETQSLEDGPSFTIVALKEDKPVGSISLDQVGEVEFADLWGSGPWIGSFHVIPEERNKGIGEALGKMILTAARRLEYTQVNFFTSNLSNVEKYVKVGAQIVDTRSYRGHTITILKISLL